MTDQNRNIILGVDTHKHFHHAAVTTEGGKEIADRQFPATLAGYRELFAWAIGHGFIAKAGVECTGSYGRGLTDVLIKRGVWVIDVIAPDKQLRRLRGKTDQIDSVNAARAVMNEIATTIPKTRNGTVEALRVLRTTRKLQVKQCTESINQLQGLIVSAPAELRESLARFTGKKLAQACSKLRDRAGDDIVVRTTREMLRSLAKRYLEMFTETERMMKRMLVLVKEHAPELLAVYGVGPDVAATMLIVAGENVDRIGTEAQFAHLIGTAPIPASSGKTNRFRLNRGGNRQGNSAAFTIVLVRMKGHQETRDYVAKSLARGRTKRDTMRQLKRYVAREIFAILIAIQTRHSVAGITQITA